NNAFNFGTGNLDALRGTVVVGVFNGGKSSITLNDQSATAATFYDVFLDSGSDRFDLDRFNRSTSRSQHFDLPGENTSITINCGNQGNESHIYDGGIPASSRLTINAGTGNDVVFVGGFTHITNRLDNFHNGLTVVGGGNTTLLLNDYDTHAT